MYKGFNHRKATQALNLLTHLEGGSIVKMKALKLLWLADRLHLRTYGRLITNDSYMAMIKGPVAMGAYHILSGTSAVDAVHTYSSQFLVRDLENGVIKSVDDVEVRVFSKTDQDTIHSVYEKFGHMTPDALSDLSHEYPEWKKFQESLEHSDSPQFPMSWLDFFEDPARNNHPIFQKDKEFLEESKEMFQELAMG